MGLCLQVAVGQLYSPRSEVCKGRRELGGRYIGGRED